MPIKLFTITEGALDDELAWLKNISLPGTIVQKHKGVYFFFLGEVEVKAVIEYVMGDVWLYLTSSDLLNHKYLSKSFILQDYCLFNIFYLPKPYKKWSSLENRVVTIQDPFWRHAYLAPKESLDEISPDLARKYRYGLIGKFHFSDWLFASGGGFLELIDCCSVDGEPLSKFGFIDKPKGIDLLAYSSL